jgi:hypothetical protein
MPFHSVTEGQETDILREIAMSTFVEKVDQTKLNANAFQGKLITSVFINVTMFHIKWEQASIVE